MSTTQHRPFTAATDKFAYAQVFTRSMLPGYEGASRRRRARLLRRGRWSARHSD